MGSYYLFFEPQDSVKLIDTLRPRQRHGEKREPFTFGLMFDEKRYGGLAFVNVTDAQKQRFRTQGRPADLKNKRSAIYTVSDLVTADLVDFTSKANDSQIQAFRADFFSPVRKTRFAYATPYNQCIFQKQMHEKGIDLERRAFCGYKLGQPVENAVVGAFETFRLALIMSPAFAPYNGRNLALFVSGKLIDR